MSDNGHVHEWQKPYVYRDFCHYSVVEKTCKECGDVHEDVVERDFDLNPLQITFARQDCAACRVAVKGNEPASWQASTRDHREAAA